MLRSALSLAFVLALGLIVPPPAARAADLCIQGPASLDHVILIGRNFKMPAKNKCKPFDGVRLGQPGMVTGAACTSSDGTHAHFTLLFMGGMNPFGNYRPGRLTYGEVLTIPALTGSLGFATDAGGSELYHGAFGYECSKHYPDNL